jgi:hypothetical protein
MNNSVSHHITICLGWDINAAEGTSVLNIILCIEVSNAGELCFKILKRIVGHFVFYLLTAFIGLDSHFFLTVFRCRTRK